MPRGKAVLRHMIADYLNVGTESKPEWALMGTGFTTLDESPGAQTESVKYVNEVSSSSTVTGYETSFRSDIMVSADLVQGINRFFVRDMFSLKREACFISGHGRR